MGQGKRYTPRCSKILQWAFHRSMNRLRLWVSAHPSVKARHRQVFVLTGMNAATAPQRTSLIPRLSCQFNFSFAGTWSAPNTNNSSKTNGMAMARAKGQPRTAPIVKYRTAKSVRWPSLLLDGMNACDNASIVVYIANVEGRRAEISQTPDEGDQSKYRRRLTGRCVPHAGISN